MIAPGWPKRFTHRQGSWQSLECKAGLNIQKYLLLSELYLIYPHSMNFVPILAKQDEAVVMLQKILQIRGFQVAFSSFEEIKENLPKCLLLFISSEIWDSLAEDQKKWLTDRPTILITEKHLKVNELRSQNLGWLPPGPL